MRIGICGTFDVGNYGDLLFPYLAQHELAQRIEDVDLLRYSYRAMSSPDWCYEVRSIQQFVDDLDDLDGLVLGGGHLVRFDKEIAPGYFPPWNELHHPTGYWWLPVVLGGQAGKPVAWNSVGSSVDTPLWARGLLREAIANSVYVSVRDQVSVDELTSVVPGAEVHLVPDTAFRLRDFLDANPTHTEQARATLAEAGITGRYIIAQPSTRLEPAQGAINRAIEHLLANDVAVLQLEISPALGDSPNAIEMPDGVTRLDVWPTPPVLASIVHGSGAAISHSFHLTVTGIAGGVPVWRMRPPESTKYEALVRYRDVHIYDEADENLGVRILADLGPADAPGAEAAESADQVATHWDRVAKALHTEVDEATVRERIRRFTMHIPFDLDAVATELHETKTTLGSELEVKSRQLEATSRQLEATKQARKRETDMLRTDLRQTKARAIEQARHAERILEHATSTADHWKQEFEKLKARKVVKIGLGAAEKLKPVIRAGKAVAKRAGRLKPVVGTEKAAAKDTHPR